MPPKDRSLLTSSVRRRILDMLLELPSASGASGPRPGLSAAEIGRHLDLHVTTARFHLDRLVEAGVVEGFREPPRAVGRPRKLYGVRGDSAPVIRTGRDATALTELMQELWHGQMAGADAEQAGFRWAQRRADDLQQAEMPRPLVEPARTVGEFVQHVETIADRLGRWGFETALAIEDGGAALGLRLTGCPFAAVARTRPDIVCAAHLGLLRALVEQHGEGGAQVRLDPLVGEGVCQARIARTTPLSTTIATRP